jgi:hypothetical protein
MASSERQYDLVLLGATGYTGKYAAEYIQENVATDFKWAIAGRNSQKLETIAKDLKTLNPDRLQPGAISRTNGDLIELMLLYRYRDCSTYRRGTERSCEENKAHNIYRRPVFQIWDTGG